MRTTFKRRWLSRFLCLVLIAVMASCAAGCSAAGKESRDTAVSNGGETYPPVFSVEDGAEVGVGETSFLLTVRDAEGNAVRITVYTNQATVGEALQEVGLIVGEEGPYGLYVKTVNGITADYDRDRAYWAFYIDGEYAMSGVDVTDIKAGEEYELAVERG